MGNENIGVTNNKNEVFNSATPATLYKTKPEKIIDALNKLHHSLVILEELVERVYGGGTRDSGEVIEAVFLIDLLDGLPRTISIYSEQIDKCVGALSDALFGGYQ